MSLARKLYRSSLSNGRDLLLRKCLKIDIPQYRNYARKLTLKDYKIVWNDPQRSSICFPENSGDLEGFKHPDSSTLLPSMQPLQKEVDSCSEITKKLLSVEFAREKDILKTAINASVKQVQNHQHDYSSKEVKIAELTTEIRFYQDKLKRLGKLSTSNMVYLNRLVGKRNKEVRLLREQCYKKFEWLLDELNILHRPGIRVYESISRKDSLRKLVDMRYYAIREKKLEEYRDELEKEKEPFLEEKVEVLKWIEDTEIELGLPVTVDVYEAEQQLKEYQQKRANVNN